MSFSHRAFPEIRAIFLAQFHPDQGPIVRLSIPEDAVGAEKNSYADLGAIKGEGSRCRSGMLSAENSTGFGTFVDDSAEVIELIKRPARSIAPADSSKIDFNSIQTLVIPKLQLFDRLVTVNTGKYKVMCYPLCIKGDNYVRNAFIFNMCFAFDIDADTKCYGPVVKRVGCLLRELEITGKLLSNPEGTRPLLGMMRQLVNKLNEHGEYQIELDLKGISQPMASTGISIKLFPYYEAPKDIEPYHVPVKIIDFDIAKRKSAQTVYQAHVPSDIMWDLVLDKVTDYIDNINHVRRIARLTAIHEKTVILALKHLDYFGCIKLVDIFRFGNVYEGQHHLKDIFRNAWLQRECHRYVTRDGQTGSISIEQLIQLYSTIRNRKTVAEWIIENDIDVDRLDVRRFFMFGVLHKMLRRVHCYPVLSKLQDQRSPDDREASSSSEASKRQNKSELGTLDMLDGTHHLDEICILEDKDMDTMREFLDQQEGINYMYL
ncbi:Nitrogen permease regulator 2 [Coemansia sp. RSA 990]|nr:Nitrogen permease regulator 2 [Coemansia sp. RSA 990]KAJ2667831.1 Nitrogen permease regulator 2 [Coemansia sp. RSA 1085]